jgi:predicted dehydrogenase
VELDEIVDTRTAGASERGSVPGIMVGFNRRFAPLAVQMRKMTASRSGPAFGVYTVNAGALPADHWAQDPDIGGGRIVGEGCHFIDFLQFQIGSPIVEVRAAKQKSTGRDLEDNVAILLIFEDGSLGQINYFSCGSKTYPKERCEMSFDGQTVVLDNFRLLRGYGITGSKRSIKQDKGHDAQFDTFVRFVNAEKKGATLPVNFETIENVMRATFGAVRAMRDGAVVAVQKLRSQTERDVT